MEKKQHFELYQSLKDCPFCGSRNLGMVESVGEAWVLCHSCHASAGMRANIHTAVDAWNLRINPPF